MKRPLNSTANRNAKVRKIRCPFSGTKYLCELRSIDGDDNYESSYWSVKKYNGRPDGTKKVKLTYEMQIEEYKLDPTDSELLLRIMQGYEAKIDIMSILERTYKRWMLPENKESKLTVI